MSYLKVTLGSGRLLVSNNMSGLLSVLWVSGSITYSLDVPIAAPVDPEDRIALALAALKEHNGTALPQPTREEILAALAVEALLG